LADAEKNAAAVRKQALAMLARREHSSAELRRKLTVKGFPAKIIDDVLSDLDGERWLSDERFVEMFIRARRERGYGPVRIRAELTERGIDDAVIAAYLDASDPEWLQRLERAKTKRFGVSKAPDFPERARQMRFFQARGFTMEQIRTVLECK
jgi:regulatory protein